MLKLQSAKMEMGGGHGAMKCVDVEVILFKHRPASAESKPKSNLFFTP